MYVGMSGYVTPVLVTNPRDYIPKQKARYQAYILENIREYECALDSLYSKRNSRIMRTGQAVCKSGYLRDIRILAQPNPDRTR